MGVYKVVFRKENESNGLAPLEWEPSCPLAVEAVQVSRHRENHDSFLQIKLRNLTGETVLAFKLIATCEYDDGSTEKVEIDLPDADIGAGREFRPKAVKLSRYDIKDAKVRLVSALTSESKWETEGEIEKAPHCSDLLALGEEAIEERSIQLEEEGMPQPLIAVALRRPCTIGDGWTECSCGQLNIGRRACLRCGLEFSMLKKLENESFLKGLHNEKERLERTNVTVVVALVVAIMFLSALAVILPSFSS